VFTAPSQVAALLRVAGSVDDRLLTAAIGPATAAAAQRSGVRVDVVASLQTLNGVAAAMAAHQARGGGPRTTDRSK
jgi:uroporphyrinogen-III synthase